MWRSQPRVTNPLRFNHQVTKLFPLPYFTTTNCAVKKKKSKGSATNQSTRTITKNALMSSTVDQIRPWKESVSLTINQLEDSRRRRKRKASGRRTKGTEACIFKLIMSKNFPKLMTDSKPQIQKTRRISRKVKHLKYHI